MEDAQEFAHPHLAQEQIAEADRRNWEESKICGDIAEARTILNSLVRRFNNSPMDHQEGAYKHLEEAAFFVGWLEEDMKDLMTSPPTGESDVDEYVSTVRAGLLNQPDDFNPWFRPMMNEWLQRQQALNVMLRTFPEGHPGHIAAQILKDCEQLMRATVLEADCEAADAALFLADDWSEKLDDHYRPELEENWPAYAAE